MSVADNKAIEPVTEVVDESFAEPQLARNGAQGHGDEIGLPPAPPPTRLWGVLVVIVLAAAIGGGLFALGWIPKLRQTAVLENEASRIRTALPRVTVAHPRQSPAVRVLQLPGDVQALEETTVYARTSGYLKRWLVDIGDHVQDKQLLAEVDTPEIDEELSQAVATLGQLKAKLLTAESNKTLADTTLRRYGSLAATNAISKQELDERRAAADTAESTVTAAKADVVGGEAAVQRLTTLQAFKYVYSPFTGTITARTIEVGQLVTSGNGVSQALFHIAKTDPVRVFVDVPQMYSSGVKAGLPAKIVVREMPGRKFEGQVTRTAGAIDPTTRTLLTEIQVPNDKNALLIGSYVQVKMDVRRENPPLLIPASALIINADGTRVALVDAQHHVHFQPVEVEGDFGADVGISAGLKIDDFVATNPGVRLAEGSAVQVEDSKSNAKK